MEELKEKIIRQNNVGVVKTLPSPELLRLATDFVEVDGCQFQQFDVLVNLYINCPLFLTYN